MENWKDGSRLAIKKEAKVFLELCSEYKNNKEVEIKFNKECEFILTEQVNLGSKKWGEWYTSYTITKLTITNETEYFYILKNGIKIKKDRIEYIVM